MFVVMRKGRQYRGGPGYGGVLYETRTEAETAAKILVDLTNMRLERTDVMYEALPYRGRGAQPAPAPAPAPVAAMRRLTINFFDGRYSWAPLPVEWNGLPPPDWVGACVEVPESTYQLWLAAAQLDAEVQVQLRNLDNANRR